MFLRRTASLAALVSCEVAALLALHHLGSYEVAAVEWGDVSGWLAQTPPEGAIVAGVRLTALALGWWLTASTVLYALASATRIPGLVRGVRWAACAPVRRTIDGALATTMVIGSTLGTSGVATAPPAVRTAVVVQLDEGDIGAEDEPLPVYQPRPAKDGVQVRYQPKPAGDPPTQSPSTQSEDPGAGLSPFPSPTTYAVRPGDNLWSIAERHLADATGRSTDEVHTDEAWAYWQRVIDANDDRLRSGDSNVIWPGERIVLP